MSVNPALGAAALAAVACATPAIAGTYRIYFRGSEALAIQSAGVPSAPPVAGYIGAPVTAPPTTTVAPACATCAPAPPNHGAGVPNQIVTFLHPYTGKAITVPLTLPVGKPTIVTRSDRIIYNYGLFSQKVVVRFLENGEVEVKYRD
jgi:hypothetical protein